MRNIIKYNDELQWTNEHTSLWKYISHTLSLKGLMLAVCEMEMGTDHYILTQVLLTIAALLSHLGWCCSTVGHWGPKALCLPLALISASCPQLTPTPTDSSHLCPGYIFVWCPPASAVLLLIYTGASLDWQLSWGSICNTTTVLLEG